MVVGVGEGHILSVTEGPSSHGNRIAVFFPQDFHSLIPLPIYLNIAAIVFCLFATSTLKSPEVNGNDRMEVSASPAAANGISNGMTFSR